MTMKKRIVAAAVLAVFAVGAQAQSKPTAGKFSDGVVRIGRAEKLACIIGHILPDNREMNSVARKAGFTVAQEPQTNECLAYIDL